jgi:hypothetical protein
MHSIATKGNLHQKPKVDLIIVTGDVADTAHPSEYEMALLFFEALLKELKLKSRQLVIVPGNHDISWPECQRAELNSLTYGWNEHRLQVEMNKVKLKHFHHFLSKLYGKSQKNLKDVIQLGSGGQLFEFSDLRLSLAALNSCERESHRTADHIGDLKKPQLEKLWKVWQTPHRKSQLRIVALHHNPTPPIPEQVENLRKQLQELVSKGRLTPELLDRYLSDAVGLIGADMLRHVVEQSRVQLVMHGHHHAAAHGGSWSWQGQGVGLCHVLAAGAWGAAEIPDSRPAVMQLIAIDSSRPADEIGIRSFLLEHKPYERGPSLEKGVWQYSGKQLNLPAWSHGKIPRANNVDQKSAPRLKKTTPEATIETVRISMAALLRLEKNGRYLLIRNLHRPEMFAPFGGVFKYGVHAITYLKDLGYQLERPFRRDLDSDVEGDLRGYISRVNFPRFIEWFNNQADREDASTCLRRELAEELTQIKAPPETVAPTSEYTFKLLRTVDEGPKMTLNEFKSYRHIEVYEPDYTSEEHGNRNRKITDLLFHLAELGHPKLLLVDMPAMARLRAENGEPLAGTVDYFLGAVRRDHEPIPFGRLEYSSVAEQQFADFLKSKTSESLKNAKVIGDPILLHAVKKHYSDSLVARLELDGIPHIIKFYPDDNIYVRKEKWALDVLRGKGVRVPRLLESREEAPAFSIMEYVSGTRLSECAVSEIREHVSGILRTVSEVHKVEINCKHYGEIIGEFTPVGNHQKLNDYIHGHVNYWRREIAKESKPEHLSNAGVAELLNWADRIISGGNASHIKSFLTDRPCLCHSDVKLTDIIFSKAAGRKAYYLLDFDNVFAFIPEFDLCKFHFNLLEHGLKFETSDYTKLIAEYYDVNVACAGRAFVTVYPFVLLRLCNWAVKRNDGHLIRLVGNVASLLSGKQEFWPDVGPAEAS